MHLEEPLQRTHPNAICLASAILWVAFALPNATGQAPKQQGNPRSPSFEVASIRPSNPASRENPSIQISPGRFDALSTSLNGLISYAYGVTIYGVSGGPDWADSQAFDLSARIESADICNSGQQDQCRLMVQSLLADRFKLSVRHAPKLEAVYILSVSRNGPKLSMTTPEVSTPADDSHQASRMPSIVFQQDQWVAKKAAMADLADLLSGQPGISRLVLDETGLSGSYDFVLDWNPVASEPRPTIFKALAKLGLVLKLQQRPLDFVIIEHVEKPSEN